MRQHADGLHYLRCYSGAIGCSEKAMLHVEGLVMPNMPALDTANCGASSMKTSRGYGK